MKKSLIVIAVVISTLSLTAYSYSNFEKPKTIKQTQKNDSGVNIKFDILSSIRKNQDFDFIYNVQSRFNTTISKEKIQNAKTIIDLLPKEATENLETFTNVLVAKTILVKDKDIEEWGENENLNNNQKKLLENLNYSENYYINADCVKKNTTNGTLESYRLVYYLTIVPEREAQYLMGQDALIDYLKEGSKKEASSTTKDNLKPGQINFTVSPEGLVYKVEISNSSNYEKLDEKMIELITNMPGLWKPASNFKGENIDQELVFFYGMQGC